MEKAHKNDRVVGLKRNKGIRLLLICLNSNSHFICLFVILLGKNTT